MKTRARGNGEGSIYRRKDGLWAAAWHLPNGKRKVVYGRTRAQAQSKLDALKVQTATGRLPSTPAKLTVGEFLVNWFARSATDLRPSSRRTYEALLRAHILPKLGDIRLTRLTVRDVEDFLRDRAAAGLAPRTVRMLRAILSAAFRDAVRWEYLPGNPAALAEGPRIADRVTSPMTPAQARAILDAAKRVPYFGPVVITALGTGLRQGELLALSWADVDLERGLAHVRATLQRVGGQYLRQAPKTLRSHRVVPLPDFVVEVLRAQKEAQAADRARTEAWGNDYDLVFTTATGQPLAAPALRAAFRRILDEAGLAPHRFHELRHGFASLLLQQQVDLRVIMELLGHSRLQTTATVYTRVAPQLATAAAQRLQDALV